MLSLSSPKWLLISSQQVRPLRLFRLKSFVRATEKMAQDRPVSGHDNSPETGPKVDVYVRFDMDSTTCIELVLPKDMVKYLVNKFTSYVPDKDSQEKVLDANPVPNIQCLKTPKIDDYLGEIFETSGKSYGKESDNSLVKVQPRVSNVMGPLGKL